MNGRAKSCFDPSSAFDTAYCEPALEVVGLRALVVACFSIVLAVHVCSSARQLMPWMYIRHTCRCGGVVFLIWLLWPDIIGLAIYSATSLISLLSFQVSDYLYIRARRAEGIGQRIREVRGIQPYDAQLYGRLVHVEVSAAPVCGRSGDGIERARN